MGLSGALWIEMIFVSICLAGVSHISVCVYRSRGSHLLQSNMTLFLSPLSVQISKTSVAQPSPMSNDCAGPPPLNAKESSHADIP